MSLCCYVIYIPKEGILDAEHFVTPVPPYLLDGGNIFINKIILSDSLEAHLGKPGIEVPLQWQEK